MPEGGVDDLVAPESVADGVGGVLVETMPVLLVELVLSRRPCGLELLHHLQDRRHRRRVEGGSSSFCVGVSAAGAAASSSGRHGCWLLGFSLKSSADHDLKANYFIEGSRTREP